MATIATLLVHGLRPEATGADYAHAEDRLWRRTSDALLSRWPKPSPSPSTARAEKGLGILGSPYYFYVMRAHGAFGYVVFLFEEIQTGATMPIDAKGATPFDSGGLWIGAIHPIKDKGAMGDLFASEEVGLDSWRSSFLNYINRNYPNSKDYVGGKPPAIGVKGITKQTQHNDPRAWTWEVRYPSGLASTWLRLERAYMHRDDHAAYLDWLPRSNYDDADMQELAKLLHTRVEVLDGERTMVFHRAETALLGLT